MKKPLLPYVPTPEDKIETIVAWAEVKPGQKSMDMGAGDGRLVIAMAKAGATAYGIEIQEKYARRAKAAIAQSGLQGKAFVENRDFWKEDLGSYSIITIYGMAMIMERVSEKLTQELQPGTIVISNGFPLPGWEILKEKDHLFLHKKS